MPLTTGSAPKLTVIPPACNPEFLEKKPRSATTRHGQTGGDLQSEDTRTLDPAEVDYEANRCFNCGCVAVSPSDVAPALIALDASIKTTRRLLRAEDFFSARVGGSTALDPCELVQEVILPPLPERTRQH